MTNKKKIADDFATATLYFDKDALAEVIEEEITDEIKL